MPAEAFALVALFAAISLVLGVVAWWLVRQGGGPRSVGWAVLPVLAAFFALYLVGHRLGLVIGPEVELFGFQVALVGDVVIGFLAALAAATAVMALTRIAARRPAR